jgi:hypothetical protein
VLNFYQIARNTFRECLREPIFFILLATALVLIGLFPSMSLFVFREQIKLVVDSAMATTLVFGLIAAVLCASHTVSREMRNGTVLLLMSKPVYRWVFIMSKIAGVSAALILFVLLCNCATLISLKIAKDQFWLDFALMYIYFGLIALSAVIGGVRNFVAKASFASNSIFSLLIFIPALTLVYILMPEGTHTDDGYNILRVIPALILIFYSVCIMGVITVALSTRFDMVPNLTLSAAIFFLGLLSGYFLNLGIEQNNVFISGMAKVLYGILPNWQFFWLADALAANKVIPMSYIGWATAYALFYIMLCSLWALALFQNREMAKDAVN